jgi:hypothetical protein
MILNFFRKCCMSSEIFLPILALSLCMGCIGESTLTDAPRGQGPISSSWEESPTLPGSDLELSFQSEVGEGIFRTWGEVILPGGAKLPYLLLNATLLCDGSPVGYTKYLMINISPDEKENFEISQSRRSYPPGNYSCSLEASGADGLLASAVRECRQIDKPSARVEDDPLGLRRDEALWTYLNMQYANERSYDEKPSRDDESPYEGAYAKERSGFEANSEANFEVDSETRLSGLSSSLGVASLERESLEGEGFIASSSSKKYHASSCRYVAKIKNGKKIFKSAQEAEEAGYNPCKVCNPS